MEIGTMNNTRAIAYEYVETWQLHLKALRDTPLEYLDYLMDEVVNHTVTTQRGLATLLTQLVPGMRLGTALRLVKLKHPDLDDAALIEAPELQSWG